MELKFENEKIYELTEKTLSSEQVYDGKLLKVYSDSAELPDGSETKREYIKHPGAVSIAALTEKDEILLVKQYRYPFRRVFTEIPAGKLDTPDEDPVEAARRELREETGFTADTFTSLGSLIPTCAYCTERIHMFMAQGLHPGMRQLDDSEFLNVYLVPFEEICSAALSGGIEDSKTLVSILKIMALRSANLI